MNAPVKNALIANARVADHPIDSQFLGRWSPRAFSEATMSESDVLALIEAARWAPSAMNLQPWRFAYGLRGDAGFARITEGLAPFNAGWAGKAAALIVVASKSTMPREGAEVANPWAAFDAGAAWAYLALQAHLNGLVAHGMGGFDAAKLAASLGLPEGHVIHAVVAVGHHGDVASLPEALQAREVHSPRRPISETAKRGGFAA